MSRHLRIIFGIALLVGIVTSMFGLLLGLTIITVVLLSIFFMVVFSIGIVIYQNVSPKQTNQIANNPMQIKINHELYKLINEIKMLLNRLIEHTDRDDDSSTIEKNKVFDKFLYYDHLTELPERIFINEILNKMISHAKRHQKICAILLININGFHQFQQNNLEIGNQVLEKVAHCFKKTLRGEDILARTDTDGFIVLLNDIAKPKFASRVADKLLQALSRPITVGNQDMILSASIGICIYPDDGQALEELLKNADQAVTQARQAGGNNYQFFTQSLNEEAQNFLQLESAFRKAMQNRELVLYYQPKYQLKTGAVNGVEALVRWVHAELGHIDPNTIISLADDTGQSMQLTTWALQEACQTNKYWQNEGYKHISVAVNLSAKQLYHKDLISILKNSLENSQLNPSNLEIEISESAVMKDIAISETILNELKKLGLQLTLDHFGTGYTSIIHLKRFPISAVKLDRGFIKGIPNNANDLAIIKALISLAHALGLQVIAEGVETAEQVEYLALYNCDIVQGYFLSHPLPADKAMNQLTKLRDEVLI